jgi:microsomal prostaglandin-E synthase 2
MFYIYIHNTRRASVLSVITPNHVVTTMCVCVEISEEGGRHSGMLRRLRTPLMTAGGLGVVGLVDRALAPPLRLSTTAAAAAGTVGSVHLYQYDICPFCNKVKALLDLHKVPYETTEVNPLTKGEVKAWSGGYRKVPIAVLSGEQVNDSPVIASTLMDRMGEAGLMTEKQLASFRSPSAMEWAKWSDEKLAVLLFPNITRSFAEAYQAFGYVMDVPHFSVVEKYSNQFVGAFFMWLAQGKIKKKYHIEDERAAVVSGINHWVEQGIAGASFAGGDAPNYADVCVFGCLKAIDRTDAWHEIMAETAIAPWYERMRSAVEPGSACTSRQ